MKESVRASAAHPRSFAVINVPDGGPTRCRMLWTARVHPLLCHSPMGPRTEVPWRSGSTTR